MASSWHHASRRATVRCRFSCVRCGYDGEAEVTAEGVGVARDLLHMDAAGADRSARTRAQNDALNRAEAIIGLAPCPRCSARNSSVVAVFIAWSCGASLALLGLGLFAGAAFSGTGVGAALGVAVGAALAVLFLRRRSEVWDHSSTVVFDKARP